ncbi:outer membrane autotransporter barrel domain protein [Rhodopseudomonas palustris TIE-1]|uniref:autotransporter-associated beta strand repeat-containing protein n=1 Tax=Rhodopseudomonas palustris TaxID=1076 RepID=UPI000164A8D0|nr:autotransporter-associated beta strand repeat-containing protein [Rhodopseudomonas palustris]ACF00407.1 outer membrane autotransporter barrel domain protein [Rhodopseudomonas palustris TIE-1]
MAYKRTRSTDIQVLLAGGSRVGARSIAALSAALLRAITVMTTLTVPAMADGGAGGQGGDSSAAGGIGGSGYVGASGGSSGPSTTAGSGGGGGGAAGGGSGGSSGNTDSVGGAAGGTTPGQDGSNGTTAASPSGGGGGAGGNNGNVATAPFSNAANSTGQNGGKGGNGGAGTDSGSTGGGGGGGGAGGVGFVFSDSSSFTNFNVTIQGGAGGNGGAGGSAAAANGNGGAGGDGGTGLLLTSPGATVTNSGTIKGGNGGAAGAAGAGTGTAGAAGAAGAGGTGIVGSGLTIINSGSIQGGLSGDGTRANSITFTGGNNTLTFMNAGAGLTGAIGLATSSTTLTFAQSTNSTLDQMITGAGSVTKAGPGVLTLTGLNTYAGGTIIAAGTLQIGDGGTTGSITGRVANGSALSFNRSDTYTLDGVISGSGRVNQLGPGTTVLTGNNNYSGGTTISAGTLQVGNGGTTGTIGSGNVNNAGILAFNRSNALNFVPVISGAGAVTQLGSGNLTLSGTNTYTGGTTISSGTVTATTNRALGTGDVRMMQGATLVLPFNSTLANNFIISGTSILKVESGTTRITGVLSDGPIAGSIEKTGGGVISLTGNNTYTGGITISAGALDIGANGSTGSITGDVINNGSLRFKRSDAYTFGGAISGRGAILQDGDGVTILTGTNTYTGTTAISRGKLQIGDGGTTGSITGGVTNNSELWFNRSDTYTFGGVISGSGRVSQLGPGTTVLTGKSTYTGGTTISAGTLQIGNGGTTGSIANNVNNAGTLAFNRSDAYTFGGAISGTGSVSQLGSGNLTLSGANTYIGGTTISGGTVTVGNNSAFGTGDVKTTQGATVAFGAADYTLANNFVVSGTSIFDIQTGTTQTITGAVSDGDTAGIIQKNGDGKLILSGPTSYSGGTIINAGTLQLANSNMLSATTAATVASGTTLDLGGFNQTIGSLAGAGSVALGAALLTTGADNSSTNYSGTMSGTGGLTKQGTGNLILSGTNDYTGPTTVNAGTLSVNGSIASAVTAASGGRLGGSGSVGSTTIASGGTLAPGNSIGTLTVNGDLTLAAGSSYAVEVSPTASDRTNLTGRATLAGTVQASYATGSYISKRYTIVNASGGVAGTFGALVDTNLPANFRSALAYDANNAYLDLMLAFVPPTAPDYGNGLSRNQQQVAGALVNSFNVAGGIPTTLGTLRPDGLSQASGEAVAALQQSLFGSADLFMRSVFSNALDPTDGSAGRECAAPGSQAGPRDACAALPPAAASASRWSVWGAGYGGTLRVGGDASTGSHDTTSRVAGAAAGASYQVSPQARVGFALGGSGSSFSLAQGLGSGSSDSFNAALYGRYQLGPSYLAAALGYVWQDATVDRTVTVAGGEALRARMHPQALTARVEGGQRRQVSGIGVTPYAALQTTTMFLPTFGETGTSVFALDYAGRQSTVTRSELGARFDDEVFIDGRPLALRARAAWAHGWNTDWQAAATLRQIPAAQFNVYGAALPGDSVQVSLGASLGLGRGWTVSAAFDGEFWKHAESYAGRALVSYQW